MCKKLQRGGHVLWLKVEFVLEKIKVSFCYCIYNCSAFSVPLNKVAYLKTMYKVHRLIAVI